MSQGFAERGRTVCEQVIQRHRSGWGAEVAPYMYSLTNDEVTLGGCYAGACGDTEFTWLAEHFQAEHARRKSMLDASAAPAVVLELSGVQTAVVSAGLGSVMKAGRPSEAAMAADLSGRISQQLLAWSDLGIGRAA